MSATLWYNRGVKIVMEKIKAAVLFCIRWRYLLALVIFALCVCLQIHGSSINEYNKIFENQAEYDAASLISGESRTIRGDEYLVNTPYQMSQQYNDFQKDSHMMSIDGQDMMVSTNAAVLDIALLAKPFNLGYILLGNDYGVSWYWCLKTIVLVLASFEFCLIVTRRNKKIALIGALMISVAPPMQWWFSSSVIDIVAFGMILFALGYYFFVSKERIVKNMIVVATPLVMTAYAIALYPAVQVPVGLFMVVLLIGVLVRDKEKIVFGKWDIVRIALMVVLSVALLGYVVLMSLDAMGKLNGTTYPGKRVSLGGDGGITDLLTSLVTFTLPYRDITYSNNCEMSTFIHFAPVFLMLYPVIYKKCKKDKNLVVGNTILGCLIVAAVFMLVGFPELLVRLTLFSYISRSRLIYGFVATVFTVWGLAMIDGKKMFTKKQILITLVVYGFLCVCMIGENELSYLSWKELVVIIVGLLIMIYLMLAGHRRLFYGSLVLLLMVSGMTVNPMVRGVTALTGHPLEQKMQEIAAEDPEAYWLGINNESEPASAASTSGLMASVGVANGARMLNMVNFYPDFQKWSILDPSGEKMDVYNRYAHIIAYLDDESDIEIGVAEDTVRVDLTCSDLDELRVKYLVLLGELKDCRGHYSKIYDDDESEYYIYERVMANEQRQQK